MDSGPVLGTPIPKLDQEMEDAANWDGPTFFETRTETVYVHSYTQVLVNRVPLFRHRTRAGYHTVDLPKIHADIPNR